MTWSQLPAPVRIRFNRLLQILHDKEIASHIPHHLLVACHRDVGSVEAIDPEERLDDDEFRCCPECRHSELRYGVIEWGSVRCPRCGWWGHESEVRRVDD